MWRVGVHSTILTCDRYPDEEQKIGLSFPPLSLSLFFKMKIGLSECGTFRWKGCFFAFLRVLWPRLCPSDYSFVSADSTSSYILLLLFYWSKYHRWPCMGANNASRCARKSSNDPIMITHLLPGARFRVPFSVIIKHFFIYLFARYPLGPRCCFCCCCLRGGRQIKIGILFIYVFTVRVRRIVDRGNGRSREELQKFSQILMASSSQDGMWKAFLFPLP